MNLLIPQWVITWLDANRGERSRQAFIVHVLVTVATTGSFKMDVK